MTKKVKTQFTSRLTQNGSDEVNTVISNDDSNIFKVEYKDDDQGDKDKSFSNDRETPGTLDKIAGIIGSVFAIAIVAFFVFRYVNSKPKFVVKANGVPNGGWAYFVAKQIESEGIGRVKRIN